MKTLFEQEIEHLNDLISRQAASAERAVQQSLQAITERDFALAQTVIDRDDVLDATEIRIEEECLKALALYQPVAVDLRLVVTLLKVNTELERIGDLAVNIAQRALHLKELPDSGLPTDFDALLTQVRHALKGALDALLSGDSFLASRVIELDDVTDRMHRENVEHLILRIRQQPEFADNWIDFMSVSRNLERIGDCCTNIGEDLLYLQQGRIVRHPRVQE